MKIKKMYQVLVAVLSMLALAVGQTAKADEVTIGSLDGAAANDYLPMNSLYEYSYTQQIYHASEIGTAGTIGSITVWMYGNADLPEMSFDIYLTHTDKESFDSTTDWIPVSSSDMVYSGTVTVHNTNAEAYTFELDIPFDYNGTDNLAVCFLNRTGNWKSGLRGMVSTLGDGVYSLYARRDTTPYDPYDISSTTATGSTSARNVITFDITEANVEGEVTLNDGTTTNGLVPIYGYWADQLTASQFIIEAADLSTIANSSIDSLTFYAEQSDIISWGNATFDVYLGEVSQTSFADATFVDWGTLANVYSGSLTISDNMMKIELNAPYRYLGGNLLVGFNQTTKGSYQTTSWYGVEATGAAIGGYLTSNGTPSFSVHNFRPKVTFSYISGGVLVCPKPKAVKASELVYDDNTGTFSDTITWTSEANAWNLRYKLQDANNWTTVAVTGEPNYLLTGLSGNCTYEVQVQTDCGGGSTSDWTSSLLLTTPICTDADQGTIRYKLTDDYGDGWDNSKIRVVHHETGTIVAELTLASGSSAEGTFKLCCGEDYDFIWVSGSSWDYECGYIFYDVNGDEIVSYETDGNNGPTAGTLMTYTMDCTITTCKKPTDLALASTPAPRSVELEWTPGETTQTTWDIAYMADGDADFTIVEAVTENPYTLTGLEPETDYTVKVRGNCGGGEVSSWSNEITFKTDEAFPTPNIVAATNITITSATLNWTGYQDSYNVRYVESYDDPIDYDFEDGSMGGWTTIDADGDGYDWVLGSASPGVYHNENVTGLTGHNESSDFIVSGSYSNYTGVALTPDNYLISPKVTLGGRISFWAQAKDATYCAEHFGVAVSTTDNTDAANFTTIAEWTLTDGEWGKYTVDLSPYADQNGYVAIRHFNCSDQFLLNIDDIAITLPDETGTEWTTLENVSGNSVVIEGLNPETTYTWQVQGIFDEGTTKWSAYSDFTTLSENPVPYDITVDAAFTAATISWKGFSDRYKVRYVRYNLFNDFESGSLNPWTTVRNDEGDEYTDWRIFDPSNFTLGITAHSGQYAAMSRSWDSSGQVGVNVDNWLISPAIPLDGSLNYWTIGHVGFGANDYPEHYDIYVSTATNDVDDFVKVYEPGDVTGEWVKHTVDLTSYNGVMGYIAFRHTDYDKDFFLIDDVGIIVGEWQEITTTDTSVELTGLESGAMYEYQIIGIKDGELDAESPVASFKTRVVNLDLNGDGDVDFADVATLADIVVGNISQAGYPMTVIDINNDGVISVADVTAFVNMLKAMP